MYKLSELFHKCNTIHYETCGKNVSYQFVEEDRHLYIYFQGSYEKIDWFRNFWFFPTRKKPYKRMTIGYKVHKGFLTAWKEVEDKVIDKIGEKLDTGEFKWTHITIVGYSHGGALAGLCHECVWFHRPDLRDGGFEGYGFEAPRFYAGWWVKKSLKERWATFHVIRNNNDLVTHAPPVLFGFTHVNKPEPIKGDNKLVNNKLPGCIKSHFYESVIDGLKKKENK